MTERAPKATVTFTDPDGKVIGKRTIRADRIAAPPQATVSPEELQRETERQDALRARAVAHAHGLWLPGDPIG